MPKFDLTISITVIVSVAAIISPVLTALLNNHHQFKIRKLELKQEEYVRTVLYKRDIFENFLRGLGQISQNATDESLDLYSKYYPLAYMYLPDDIRQTLSQLNTVVHDRNWEQLVTYVDSVSSDIYKVLQAL